MKRFQNILVPVDTRFESQPALEWAVKLVEHNQAALKIVEVLPEFSWHQWTTMSDAEDIRRRLTHDSQNKLNLLAEPLRARNMAATTKVLAGRASVQIAQEVLRSNHDLVVRVTKGTYSQATGNIRDNKFAPFADMRLRCVAGPA